MSTLQERIGIILQATGWSVGKLAEVSGVSSSAVSQWKDGPTKSLKAAPASKLAAATGFNALWIAEGEGAPGAGPTAATQKVARIKARPILAWETPDDLPEGEFVFVPLLDVRLSAGHGTEQVEIYSDETRPLAFRADWIRQMRLKPGRLLAMWAKGDSMEPRIQNGDALVVDQAQTQVVDGGVFALWYEGGERVKRLYRLPGGRLRITSDNPSYGPIELSAEETEHVRIIGRVVHVAGQGGL